MEYNYTALDKNGNRVAGQTQAESISILVSQLKNQGMVPLRVANAKAEKKTRQGTFLLRRGVKLADLTVVTRQLAATINSGLTLTEALEMIHEDIDNRYLHSVLEAVVAHIRAGSNFSGALLRYPKVFPHSFIAVVQAGEESGSLGRTLEELAKYLEDTLRLTRKIKSAMHYPMFIVGFFIFVVSIIVFFIIPKFKMIFMQAQVELPLLTRVVVGVSETALRNIHWIILLAIFSVFGLLFILKFPKIRLPFDRYILRIFLFGKIIKKVAITRFCRTLSILLSGGVGLITALPISCDVANNLYLKQVVYNVKKRILSGSALSMALKEYEAFPPMVVKMVQVGEKTGKLSDMLKRNADYYDQELEAAINSLTSLIEPILIVLIGAIVGVVVVAFYLPIFKISLLVK